MAVGFLDRRVIRLDRNSLLSPKESIKVVVLHLTLTVESEKVVRIVAIREFAPANIVYYEGNKFQIAKTRVSVKGIDYQRVSLCHNCGYFHDGELSHRDTCENCAQKITADLKGNSTTLTRVLEMETAIARRRERITCDEEERLKYGYRVTTHFRYDDLKKEDATVTATDGTLLLRLSYGETAKIWRINQGWQHSNERGFKLDATTGMWGDNHTPQTPERLQTEVSLMVSDTCNILVLEAVNLPETSTGDFLATFQFALQRAIAAAYKLETNELASERLGDGKYLLFWEAAEGGAGVLSQILTDQRAFQRLAQEALDICHFKQPKDSCTQACYECLLSYQNQFDHPRINRYLIRDLLEQLTTSILHHTFSTSSRQEHYQRLLEQTDPNSEFERVVLEEIYRTHLRSQEVAASLLSISLTKQRLILVVA